LAPDDELLDVLQLDRALSKLEIEAERAARIVELKVFGGLTAEEIGLVLGVSPRTVVSDWKVARLWLAHEMGSG
jgi:DNA-directed RNA polymerase specialized sigma24 family protein